MNLPFRDPVRWQRGIAAVEAAVIISFVLLPLLAFSLLFGRYYWYYTAAQKAAHDAAIFMAVAPLDEVRGTGRPAVELANQIMIEEMSDIATTADGSMQCGYGATNPVFAGCVGTLTPVAVRATVLMNVTDPIMWIMTTPATGQEGIPLLVQTTAIYVGH
jgi:hypothetical protein